jgi:hypothetical protein
MGQGRRISDLLVELNLAVTGLARSAFHAADLTGLDRFHPLFELRVASDL